MHNSDRIEKQCIDFQFDCQHRTARQPVYVFLRPWQLAHGVSERELLSPNAVEITIRGVIRRGTPRGSPVSLLDSVRTQWETGRPPTRGAPADYSMRTARSVVTGGGRQEEGFVPDVLRRGRGVVRGE